MSRQLPALDLRESEVPLDFKIPHEGLMAVVLRRAFTMGRVLAAFVLLSVLFLPLGLVAVVIDLWRKIASGVPFTALKLLTFCWVFLWSELVGIALLLGGWFLTLGRPGVRETLAGRIQLWWTRFLLGVVRRLFGLRFEVSGEDCVSPGPILVLVRHVSLIDTLLPTVFISGRHGIRLRFVLKRELLNDPCIDLAGHWLKNYFVARGKGSAATEIAAIRRLAGALGPGEGVLIYPEGTRFSIARQAAAWARLQETQPNLLERARAMTHVLPPRLGGPLALLETRADVLFLAHTGLENLSHFRDLWNGGLHRRVIRLQFWRVSASEIPETRADKIDWLYQQWAELNERVRHV